VEADKEGNCYPSDGEWKPTRKGIAIPVELYGELISALREAEPLIKKLPPATPAKKDEG